MSTFGRTAVATVGRPVSLSADGEPEVKEAGVTLDWTTVAAAGTDTTVEDSVPITAGEKYLRHGQVITKITASGKYGPYDPAAADGRQLMVRGQCFLINRTIKENDLKSDHPTGVLEGGLVFLARLIQSGVATHTLALGPTRAEIEAMFPRLRFVE